MRWMPLAAFEAGDEPDPYPHGVPAVRRRLRAVPVPTHHWWPLGMLPMLASALNRRRRGVSGAAWVPVSALHRDRRRRWALAALGLLDLLALVLAAADISPAALLVPVLTLALVIAVLTYRRVRVSAVLDERTGYVGIVGHQRTQARTPAER
jgi:hypothetical protein